MTWGEFKTDVTGFLEADGKRRGLEAFRAAHTRAALSDLAHYIDELAIDVPSLVDANPTPFDSEIAEAVAEWIKGKVARITGDPGLAREYQSSYMTLRRRNFIRLKEARYPELRPFVGKPFVLSLIVKRNYVPMPLTGEVWFTVKQFRGDSDANAVIQQSRATGLDVTDWANGRATIVLTADDTAKLCPGVEYFWDVQAEDEIHHAIIPDNLTGTLRPRQPVTISNP